MDLLGSRNKCIVCDCNSLTEVYCLQNVPAFMGTTLNDPCDDALAPLEFLACDACGVIQIQNPLPIDLVYLKSHGAGSIGGVWLEHHQKFGEFLIRHATGSVLEIGGGSHGTLSRYCSSKQEFDWTVVDKDANSSRYEQGVNVVSKLYGADLKLPQEFETCVHSHFFEHLYQPDLFLKLIEKNNHATKKMVFSVPNFNRMLELGYIGTLDFEHTYTATEECMRFLMQRAGYEIEEVEYFKDHSVFMSYVKCSVETPESSPNPGWLLDPKISGVYFANFEQTLADLHTKIIDSSASAVFLFGAHTFSQFLLARYEALSQMCTIIDNDPNKQGQRLYGTDRVVHNPNELAYCESPLVITSTTGAYKNEIEAQCLQINSTCSFG